MSILRLTALLALVLLSRPLMAQDSTAIFGVPTDDLTDATPDGWDLTVVITQPIDGPEGEVEGRVDTWNYYASDKREVTEFLVTPLLVKNEDGAYTVVGVGETHEPEEPGPQLDVPFNVQKGTNELNIENEDVTYHIGFIGQRPDFGGNDDGGIIPFGAGGPGMFAMDTQPDTEFQINDEVTSNHASAEGGRDYQYNFAIEWGAPGPSATTTFGVPTDELTDATPDGWDLTVVITQPISPGEEAEGEVDGMVDKWNYYASDKREVTEFLVTPLLVKNEDGAYTIVGVGETHEPKEPGSQLDVPFNLQDGTDEFSVADEDVTFHIGFIGQRPDFGGNDAGGIIPFGAGGPGMFAMDTQPDTEFQINDEVTSNHASAEGGRDYQYNFVINWGGTTRNPDLDGDGMPNTWEQRYALNPRDASDAAGDKDNDGLTNLQEFELELIPDDPDTDDDGVPDGAELGVLSLTTDQEVPAPTLGDATPGGFANISVDSDTRTVEISGTYSGMTSDVSAAHLHGLADPGAATGVLFGLTVTGGTEGTFSGSGVLSEEDFNGFMAGLTYINVHTANNGPGEIRGQVPGEFILTNPKDKDSDDDGLLDGVETNTGKFVSAMDTGTHPNIADTDGGGQNDGSEVRSGRDPHRRSDDVSEYGADDWFDGQGGPDVWDLTVILTSPIEGPVNATSGTVEYLNYYHVDNRPAGDYTVAPVLVKHIEDTDEYVIVGVGENHVAEEAGPQAEVPFIVKSGSNVIDLTEPGVTWHPAVFQGHPGHGNSNGAVIPYAGDGAGMFAYDSGPDEELEESQVLNRGHASAPGGRHYKFNLGVRWGAGTRFQITAIDRDDTGQVTLTWETEPNEDFEIEKSPSMEPGTWTTIMKEIRAAADPAVVTTAIVDTDLESPVAYYRVAKVPPPPLFGYGFEDGLGEFTVEINGIVSDTEWEVGAPVNPPGPNRGANVAATDLDADFADGILNQDIEGISLRSPVIELTGRSRVTLSFWHFLEVNDGASGGRLNILRADNLELILGLDDDQSSYLTSTPEWTEVRVRLPEAAVEAGKVFIDWEFLSVDDGDPDNNGAGWFIDDVAID